MSVEISCNGCGSTLSVSEEHRGKKARCPKCGQIQVVPLATEPGASADVGKYDSGNWYVRTPSGETYGPASRGELEQWAAEGRVTAECQVRNSAQGDWAPADSLIPTLQSLSNSAAYAGASVGTAASNYGRPTNPATSSYAQAQTSYARPQINQYAESHRGGLILTLGLLSWIITCPFFGIADWVIGAEDLRKISRGQMDGSGRDLTYAGYILGMIHVILSIITFSGFLCCAIAGNA